MSTIRMTPLAQMSAADCQGRRLVDVVTRPIMACHEPRREMVTAAASGRLPPPLLTWLLEVPSHHQGTRATAPRTNLGRAALPESQARLGETPGQATNADHQSQAGVRNALPNIRT
jgi:hypothetical protein